MDDTKAEVVRLWIKKADHDLQNIANNLSAIDIPTDTLCFHAQQAIEKIFKGLMVDQGMTISKTHDLSAFDRYITNCTRIARI